MGPSGVRKQPTKGLGLRSAILTLTAVFSPLPIVAEPLPFPSGGGKSFLLGGSDDVLENVLGLGDLADLTVANDDTDYSYDVRRMHADERRPSSAVL